MILLLLKSENLQLKSCHSRSLSLLIKIPIAWPFTNGTLPFLRLVKSRFQKLGWIRSPFESQGMPMEQILSYAPSRIAACYSHVAIVDVSDGKILYFFCAKKREQHPTSRASFSVRLALVCRKSPLPLPFSWVMFDLFWIFSDSLMVILEMFIPVPDCRHRETN